jgi:glycosyltransferase involved in cell wall biosynthesis
LEARVRDLGLQQKIRFLGQLSSISDVLSAADVFVLASRNEGSPLSVMEAMSAGLPVVATAVGGVPELVEDQISGTLVRPSDCDGMAAAMLQLFHNTDTRKTMATRAAQRALRDFSLSRMVQGYTDLYERLVAEQVRVEFTRRPEMFSLSYH